MGLVYKNEHKIYHMHYETEYEITYDTHDISLKFIFILSKTSLMLGPHKNPIYLHKLISQISLFQNYEKSIHLCKIKRNGRLFGNQSAIKTDREKIGFLKFI